MKFTLKKCFVKQNSGIGLNGPEEKHGIKLFFHERKFPHRGNLLRTKARYLIGLTVVELLLSHSKTILFLITVTNVKKNKKKVIANFLA